MGRMVTVQLDSDDMFNMLIERCHAWGTSKDNLDLFEQMYENYIDSGCFDGGEFNVMQIVDNDVVNYCDVVSEGDENYEDLIRAYREDNRDTSYGYIEAVSDDETRILVR